MDVLSALISGSVRLPAMPSVVRDGLQALRDNRTSLPQLAAQVALDPVLASRVLQIANSAHYAGRQPLSSVRDAIAVMGLSALEGMLLLYGSVGAFTATSSVDMPTFWRRSVMTGTCARQWAKRWGIPEDQAHSAGLLQGLGHVILCHCLPEQATAAFGPRGLQAAPCSLHELAERERTAFGVAHPEVSAWWAAEIGLPDSAVDAIEHALAPPDATAPPLTQALMAACLMSAALERGTPADTALADIEPLFLRAEAATPDLSE